MGHQMVHGTLRIQLLVLPQLSDPRMMTVLPLE
jgi:hypothetical protein